MDIKKRNKSKEDMEFIEIPKSLCSVDPIGYAYFDALLNDRTIVLNEEICGSIIESVYMPLKKFEEDDKDSPVTLIINTVGGSVYDSLFLCNVIDNYKKPLNIIVPGYAMSMGTILLCAGASNPNVTKYCYKFSIALMHAGEMGVQGEARSVEDIMDFNKKLNGMVRDYILANTAITEDEYDKHDRKQWYLTSDDMLNYGLVNKIIGCDD